LVLASFFNNRNYLNIENYQNYIIFIYEIVAWIFFSRQTNLYDELRTKTLLDEFIPLIKMLIYATISMIVFKFIFSKIHFNSFFVFSFSLLLFLFTSFSRVAIKNFLTYIRKRGINIKKILVIGAGNTGLDLYKTVLKSPNYGYQIVGFLDDRKVEIVGEKYLGKIDELKNILENKVVNEVIIALPNSKTDILKRIIEICEYYTKRVRIIPTYAQIISERFVLSRFDKFPVLTIRSVKLNDVEARIIKRLFDTVISIFLIFTVFIWLFPIIIILIKFDSPGSAFFSIERWGRDNKKFNIYKFRSMFKNVPTKYPDGKHVQTTKNDSRITRVGKYLRKFNIDELPQIFNVLKGEMSLVGPRPHSTPLNQQARSEVPHYMVRHFVKPGLTGWAQVNGYRGETKTVEAMQKRIEYDI